MNRPYFSRTLTALAVVLSLTTVTVVASAQNDRAGNRSASETYKALTLFGDVFEQVRASYVEPVEDKKLIEYALNGMLANLDPHSAYMTQEETKAMSIQNRGEFGGLGIEVTMENGLVKVVSPIDDTPAARAGVQAGDMIVEIDSKPVMGMTLSDAIDKMRGPAGTEINLSLIRQGAKEPLKVKLVRDIIQIQSVKYRVEDDNIGYIRITTFNAQTEPGLKKAFAEIQKQAGNKLAGYVLDLRNNPGGLLDMAIYVSDAFLEKGDIVSTRGRNAEDQRIDRATSGDMARGLPIVTLINGGSASASEIVAGALQDNKRAITMGTQSFGKGSVQTLFDAPGGGSIKLTTARYFTPSGKSIQAKGITPDIIVERAKIVTEKDSFNEIHEVDLKGALQNPDTPAAEEKAVTVTISSQDKDAKDAKDGKKADPKAEDKNDYQLRRAIDLLHGITIYRDDTPVAPVKDDAKAVKDEAKKEDKKTK